MSSEQINIEREQPVLLWVLEQGGYPDFSGLYHAWGYRVVKAQGVRKALAALKTLEPQVVVAEFNYAPTYGSRISPVEPLLARLQTHHPMTRLLLFAEPERLPQLKKLEASYGDLPVIAYPILVKDLEDFLKP